jgi:protein arginine N-methyltransferase 1
MTLYDIVAHGAMLGDAARFAAYRDALERVVQPGCTVLDIGTGSGIHALLACRLGARRVFAVEPTDVIQVARQIARDNGLADRIEFHQELSTRVSLPEPADVMVSDLRGVLPLFQRHIPAIVDARRRLLRPGGALIPLRDVVHVAPVDAATIYEELTTPWQAAGDLDMRVGRDMALQQVHRRRFEEQQLLAPARVWTTIDYATVETPDARAELELTAQRPGTVHGFALWFDSELAEGVALCNAPGAPPLIYGMSFLPLSQPVEVQEGAALRLDLEARLVNDDYLWRWQCRIDGRDGVVTTSQSSFHGTPLAPRTLSLAAADATPELSQDGLIDREALAMMDGATPLADIAERLHSRYPDAFPGAREALDRVAALARRYAG